MRSTLVYLLLTYQSHVSYTRRELYESVKKWRMTGNFSRKATVGYVHFPRSIWELTSVEVFVLL